MKSYYVKLLNAIVYSILPIAIIVPNLMTSTVLTGFVIYLLALVAIFGGLNGFLINCDLKESRVSVSYLKMIREETLQLVWPCIFFFVITLVGSPFVAETLGKDQLANPKVLMLVVWIGIIGFQTLISIPQKNLEELRVAIITRTDNERVETPERKNQPDKLESTKETKK